MSSPARIFVICLLGLLVFSTLCISAIYWQIYGYPKLFGDFATFHAAAQHLITHQLAAVYDIEKVKRLFETHGLKDFAFFLNPPTGLFIVYPLGFLDALPGLILWSLVQLALLWAVLRSSYTQYLFMPLTKPFIPTKPLVAIVFIAFCLQNFLYGQLAVLCSVLFLSVLALRKTHPVWAGMVLGIFSFKPQLGLLLPVLLIAEGNIKTLLWAGIVTVCMAMLSYLLWGGGLWQDYVQMMQIRGRFMAEAPDLLFVISMSVYAALRNIDLEAGPAFMGQFLLALAAIFYIWPLLRKGKESHKILMLTYAAYLVTPYVLTYDMVLLAVPCGLLLRKAEANLATRSELIALFFLILMPLVAIILQIEHIPYSVIAIGLGLIVARSQSAKELTLHG